MPRKKLKLLIKGVNGVSLNLCECQAVVRELAEHYRRAGKRDKGKLLGQLQALTRTHIRQPKFYQMQRLSKCDSTAQTKE